MLVDDAVVVGESAHASQQTNPNLLAGAIHGAQRVLLPVTFGVLTTIAAFTPLLFATGVVGQALSIVAAVVICCLIASLIECQWILPAHLGARHALLPIGGFGVVVLTILVIGAFVVTSDDADRFRRCDHRGGGGICCSFCWVASANGDGVRTRTNAI